MNSRKKWTLLLAAIVLPAAFSFVQSQVTVGSGIEPARAALLDFKEHVATSENETVDNGGLVLPRVKLEDKKTLDPFIDSKTDPEWLSLPAKVKKEHVGLVVYNLSKNNGFDEGTYVWDGNEWSQTGSRNAGWGLSGNAGTNPATNYIGTSDAAALSIRANNKEAMRVTANGEVAFNNIPLATSADSTSQLVLDNATGTLKAVGTKTNSKMFNYIKYELSNVNGDYVYDFDTKIPKDEYTLVVVGSSFDKPILVKGKVTPGGTDNGKIGSYYWYSAPVKVSATVRGNTWRLEADYTDTNAIDSNTGASINGTWKIQCVAINNSVVKELATIKFDMGGKSTDAASQKPSGL